MRAVRFACLLMIAIPLLRLLLVARGFPIIHDGAIIRYVAFMIDRGHAPYTWMVEMNPPGTLMTEWLSVHTLGSGRAGMWWWDALTGALAVAGAARVADAQYRLPAVSGVLVAWFLHLMGGPIAFGERDWFVAALLMACCAFARETERRGQPAWVAGTLALGGWAATIKPYALIVPLLLLGFAIARVGGVRARLRLVRWAAVGVVLPGLAVLFYFHHWPGSFLDFLVTERSIGAWYATVGNASARALLLGAFIRPLVVLMPVAVLLWGLLRPLQAADATFAVGAAGSTLMYLLQRKGFPYQAYPMVMFLLAGGAVAAQRGLQQGLRRGRAVQIVAALFLAVAFVWIPVSSWRRIAHTVEPTPLLDRLIVDLDKVGGSRLDGRVQCLDMTGAHCIAALLALHLQQSTGFVNDHILFPFETAAFTPAVRAKFLQQFAASPPEVIILSNHNWPSYSDRTFSKPGRWPEFAAVLQKQYRLDHEVMGPDGWGYEVYRRTAR